MSIKPIRSLSWECVNTFFYWGMKCPPSRFLLSKMLLGKVREILNRLSKWAIPSRARQLAIMLEIGNNNSNTIYHCKSVVHTKKLNNSRCHPNTYFTYFLSLCCINEINCFIAYEIRNHNLSYLFMCHYTKLGFCVRLKSSSIVFVFVWICWVCTQLLLFI